MTRRNFRLAAGWCAILSMLLALGTILFSAAALQFDAVAFNAAVSNNAAAVLPVLAENPAIAWWPSIFDFFGFYLLLLPLALYLHQLLKTEAPDWMILFTVCGLGYIFLGAMGAAVTAVIFSTQAAAYASTTGTTQQMHLIIFEAFGDAIQRGVWGILDPVLAGMWWIGIGLLLRKQFLVLGGYTFVLGLVNIVGGLSAAIGFEAAASICLNLYFLMAPIWAGWAGVSLLRHDDNLTHPLTVPLD